MSNINRTKPSRRALSTSAELDHQLALMRRSKIVPVRESFALSSSSICSEEVEYYEDCPVILVSFEFLGVVWISPLSFMKQILYLIHLFQTHGSRLAQFAEMEYLQRFVSGFDFSKATTFRINEVPTYTAYTNQNHCFFRTSIPCNEYLNSDDDEDLFSDYGFSKSIPLPQVTFHSSHNSHCS